MKKVGIDSISFYVPNIYLSIEELSASRDLEFEKLNKGLGLNKMSIPDIDEDPATFAANALIDLIEKNNINLKSIGRIYMGTESALDSSKPTCTYATELVEKYFEPKYGKRCLKNCDVSDITFACIGGVDALQNSLDWVSNNHGKKAIVVCSDLSKYELNSTGEYTQGAGAVALLVSEDPSIISINNQWGVATKSEKDFFKPRRTFHKKELINEIIKKLELNFSETEFELALKDSIFWNNNNEKIEIYKEEPVFDGQYSNECYEDRMNEALENFNSYKKTDFLNHWDHIIFHLPYAYHGRRIIFNNWLEWTKNDKKLEKLVNEIGPESGPEWTKKAYKSSAYKNFINEKIMPGELASSEIGNMYTASIFMSFLSMLSYHLKNQKSIDGNNVAFISYGSGSKAKIFSGTLEKKWKEKITNIDLFKILADRKEISFKEYEDLHRYALNKSISKHSVKLSHIDKNPSSAGYRNYKL